MNEKFIGVPLDQKTIIINKGNLRLKHPFG